MNETLKRSITGLGFIIVMIGSAFLGQWTFMGLLGIINILALNEYGGIFKTKEYAPFKSWLLIIGTAFFGIFSCVMYNAIKPEFLISLVPLLLLFLIIELYNKRDAPFERAGISVLGIIYISFSLAIFQSIAQLDGHFDYTKVVGCMLLIWSNDSWAYVSGRLFGKHPLFPSISPKKTWEGSIGGGLCTLGMSALIHYFFPDVFTLFEWMGLSVIFVVFSIWGDLAESRLKRSFDIKDSGVFLPGHGGVLDRFDAQLFSIPFAAAFLWLMQ